MIVAGVGQQTRGRVEEAVTVVTLQPFIFDFKAIYIYVLYPVTMVTWDIMVFI